MIVEKKNSRVSNTIYNFVSSMGGQFITILMQFIVRTVFIKTLGKSYLGINGLYSNILNMLSLTEFGFSNAILFKLYEPIAKNDYKRLAQLMELYKKIYRIIGAIIAGVGLCLIPFLPILISDYDKLEKLHINAVFIFILYLLKSVTSYLFFSYKSAIIGANQKEYLINIVSYVFTIVAGIAQIICLILFTDFVIYVVILVLQVILQNICCARMADKMYPYINEKCEEKVATKEIKGIFKDCSALFIYNVNSFVIKSTDNIIISAVMGISYVALYSNYYILYTTFYTLFSKIYDSLTHSLGNLHTEKDKAHEYQIFKSINLVTCIIGGTAFVGIACVADELITAWIGSSWVIKQPFAFLIGLELYTLAVCKQFNRFRNIMGLFQQAKYRPVAGCIINLGVSVALVHVCGIYGVLIGTIVADWLTFVWFDPMIIHKYGFENKFSLIQYYLRFAKQFLIVVMVGIVDYIICNNFLTGWGWLSVVVHSAICGISVPLVVFLIYRKTEEGKYLVGIAKRIINKFIHIKKNA